MALFAVGACSRIIGVADLEIDPSLDTAGQGDAGASGSPGSGEAGQGGETGQGGASHPACEKAADCDDDISCTKDDCSPTGECTHTADDTACTPAAGTCTHCQLGIGCVDSAPIEQELLSDASFEEGSADWQDFSDVNPVKLNADAQSGEYAAHFSSAPADAEQTRFSNLSQLVHIPAGTVKLTASGWYRMQWAEEELDGRPRSAEYVSLALFSPDVTEDGDYIRYWRFESWEGAEAEQASWESFSYDAPRSVLNRVRDLEVTLDLVAETWDTTYDFDSLSLRASVCE